MGILPGIKSKYRYLFGVLLICVGLAGCTLSGYEQGKPLPEITFAHVKGLTLAVDDVVVESTYDPLAHKDDSTVELPEPPDLLLRRFFEHRLVPAGGRDSFHIAIEDARVVGEKIKASGALARLVDMGTGTRYQVSVRLRLYFGLPHGYESDHSVLSFEKAFTIPDYMSVADREAVMFQFLEELITDIDHAVTSVLFDHFSSYIKAENDNETDRGSPAASVARNAVRASPE